MTKSIDQIDKSGNVVKDGRDLFDIYIPAKGDSKRGGLYFVSSSGGYGHANGEVEGADAIPIPINFLITTVGGFPKGNSRDEVNKLARLATLLKSDKKFLEKANIFLSVIKAGLSVEKAGEKVGIPIDQIIKNLSVKQRMYSAENVYCLKCQSSYKVNKIDSTLTYEQSDKNPKDTVNSHEEANHK